MWLPTELGLHPVDRGMASQFRSMCQLRIGNQDTVIRKILGVSLCLMGKSVGLNGDAYVGTDRAWY